MSTVTERTRWTPSSYWSKWVKGTAQWPELHEIATGCHTHHSDEQRRDSSLCPQCSAAYKAVTLKLANARRHTMAEMNRAELARYGLKLGQRVECFCPSMLGLGGMTVAGTVKLYRGRVCVDVGHKVDTTAGPRRYVSLGSQWKATGNA